MTASFTLDMGLSLFAVAFALHQLRTRADGLNSAVPQRIWAPAHSFCGTGSAKRGAMAPDGQRMPIAPRDRRHAVKHEGREERRRPLPPVGGDDAGARHEVEIAALICLRLRKLDHDGQLAPFCQSALADVGMPAEMPS